MLAISLWQPHASLIVGNLKPYETRSWAVPSDVIGQRIWIHAAKAENDLAELGAYYLDWKESGERDDYWHKYLDAIVSMGYERLTDLPRGALVGSAILAACVPTAYMPADEEPGPFGDFTPGRFAWRMESPVRLPQPIPFRGDRGFFTVPDGIERTPDAAPHSSPGVTSSGTERQMHVQF